MLKPYVNALPLTGAGGRSSGQAAASQHLLRRILATFKIVDWTVFGEEEEQ